VVFIQDLPTVDPNFYVSGQDLMMSSVIRNSKKALDPNVKSGNYLNNILALGEAKRKKIYDSIMVDKDGRVTEGTTWNIFIVKNETYITPPDEADILHGITRKILRRLAKENGLKWEERFFTAEELKTADEVFSSSSIKEVMGVRSVDGALIGGHGNPGPMTKKLAQIYKDYVKKYCQDYKRSHKR
jgi:branched-chain amino acid aminotransferase